MISIPTGVQLVTVQGGRQVFKYEGSGSFGELALLYNCPRAATVQVWSFACVLSIKIVLMWTACWRAAPTMLFRAAHCLAASWPVSGLRLHPSKGCRRDIVVASLTRLAWDNIWVNCRCCRR